MEIDQARWLARFIQQAISEVEQSPGLTIEAGGDAGKWLQLLPEEDDVIPGQLTGFVLNFTYDHLQGDPSRLLVGRGLKLPPDTRTLTWEDGGYAIIWLRPDVPPVVLALLIGDVIARALSVDNDQISVQIEYGF